MHITLNDRAVLKLTGADTHEFLQRIITNDITRLTEEQALYALLLTPQGKLIADFFLVQSGDIIWLDVNASLVSLVRKKLTMYKLRADVAITEEPDKRVYAITGEADTGAAKAEDVCFQDPRHPDMGKRVITDHAGDSDNSIEVYEQKRISLTLPDGVNDMGVEESFPLEFGLDALHAIDFDKGCYVGQEVTARSKHRGKVKKKLVTLQSSTAVFPPKGTAVMQGNAKVGVACSSSGSLGLALLKQGDGTISYKNLCADGIMLEPLQT